jgi:hypothetical protein
MVNAFPRLAEGRIHGFWSLKGVLFGVKTLIGGLSPKEFQMTPLPKRAFQDSARLLGVFYKCFRV